MVESLAVREVPAASPLHSGPDPSHPDVSQGTHPEPRLEVEQIQGNILPGFLKDHETLLFLRIDGVPDCKRWLITLVPLIATADEVLTFNRLFKRIRSRRGRPSHAVKATWVNIAFSYLALERLTNGGEGDLEQNDFTDQAFKDGLADRSAILGDPATGEGSRDRWLIGGPGNEADIVIIVQSDDPEGLHDQVREIEEGIFGFRGADGTVAPSGVRVIFKQHGAILPGALSGHEHFGFLDGLSQPGIRGYVSSDPTDVLTPRQNPRDSNQGKPGQDLLWPGEFVFGYEYQDPEKAVAEPSDGDTQTAAHRGRLAEAGPAWAQNGSFMVFRRLYQDVAGFHRFLHAAGRRLGRDPRFIGAKIVGRWPSGAPLLRAAAADDPELGNNDCANNDFEFFHSAPSPAPAGDGQCPASEQFAPSPADPLNLLCPAFAHIRKAYPRDDITPAGAGGETAEETRDLSEQDTQTHRLLRRGLPYGEASLSTPEAPFADAADRGLLFVCYQTSIENQFEFVTRNRINNPNFRNPRVGFDLLIGQNGAADRTRTAALALEGPNQEEILAAPEDWVIPTGGGYFFAPSLGALAGVLAG